MIKEPELNELVAPLSASAKGKGSARFRGRVPVHFHVVSGGAVGNVTPAQIDDQIRVMTSRSPATTPKTGFTFRLEREMKTGHCGGASLPGT